MRSKMDFVFEHLNILARSSPSISPMIALPKTRWSIDAQINAVPALANAVDGTSASARIGNVERDLFMALSKLYRKLPTRGEADLRVSSLVQRFWAERDDMDTLRKVNDWLGVGRLDA